MRILSLLLSIVFLLSLKAQQEPWENTEYLKVKSELLHGWNTSNTWNMLSYVKMPQAYEVAIDFKYQGANFSDYLRGGNMDKAKTPTDPVFKPIAHSGNGDYMAIEVTWQAIKVLIEVSSEGDTLVGIITPISLPSTYPSSVIIRSGLLWNKLGNIQRINDSILYTSSDSSQLYLKAIGVQQNEYNVNAQTPYFSLRLGKPIGFTTGNQKNIEEVYNFVKRKKNSFESKASIFGKDLGSAYKGIITSLAYNTIYDPIKDRIVSTVSRTWNVSRGGYGFFGWDNFFMSYLWSLDNKEMAYSQFIEHLHDMTPEGFIPNNSQGNGRQSLDRSQPPVGSIIAKEIYKKYKEKWFIEAVFDRLLLWNRWWMSRRYYNGMLCWGSHKADNPFNDKRMNDLKAAMLETGIDDSPMYDSVLFDAEKGIMLLHDAGLNALYIADCEALREMAELLGRDAEAIELSQRSMMLKENIKSLYDETDKFYYNRSTVDSQFVKVKSPTLFYPLMTGVATSSQAKELVLKNYYDSSTFGGEFVLPSISRDHPSFSIQKYWKGSIWGPLNFLVYYSFCKYDLSQARADLSSKSLTIFLKAWETNGFICENYSGYNGTCDDPRLQSHPFYSWGSLMAIMAFIEKGYMPFPGSNLD